MTLTNGSAYIPTSYAFTSNNPNCLYTYSYTTSNGPVAPYSPLGITNITAGVGFYISCANPSATNWVNVGILTNGGSILTNGGGFPLSANGNGNGKSITNLAGLTTSNVTVFGDVNIQPNPPTFTACISNASQVLANGTAGPLVYMFPGSSDGATQMILTNGASGPSTNTYGRIWGTNTFAIARTGTNYVVTFSLFNYQGETINPYQNSPPGAFYASNYTTAGFVICSTAHGSTMGANTAIGVAWTVIGN